MRFAILLALMILTAGCLGGADTNPKNDPRPEPTDDPEPVDPPPGPNPGIPGRVALLLDFQYTQCSGIEAQFNIAPATAQALLPANFTARDDLGRTSDQALVRFRILACDQFSSANVAINDTVYGDVAILIDDPGIEASGDLTWYRLRIFAADDNLALAWQIAGYDVVIGDVTRSTSPLQQTSLAFDGYEAQWFDTLEDAVADSEASFSKTPDGLVVWSERVDEVETSTLGIGTFSVPSSDPLAGSVGADPTAMRLIALRHVDILEANLILLRST